MVMRDRSGRSGRRRGSQKPGTACGAAATADFTAGCAAASVAGEPTIRFPSEITHIARTSQRGSSSDLSLLEITICDCIGKHPRGGLIDHPAAEASAFEWVAFGRLHGSDLRFLRPHGWTGAENAPPASRMALVRAVC